jgi:hypothetical protein
MPDTGRDEDKRFVWRNIDAYLAGELGPEETVRVEAFLSRSPHALEFANTQRMFSDAVRHSMSQSPMQCPDGLRDKVLAALDQCEAEVDYIPAAPFPWLGATVLAAASVVAALGLFYYFGVDAPEPGLTARLVPMVASAPLDAARSEKCRYRLAVEEYRSHFPDGPDIPRYLDGKKCRVSDFRCDEINGRPVMYTVFDSPDGDRFAVMIFKGECLGNAAPDAVRAAELEMEGRLVSLWREGKYMLGLVAKSDDAALRRRLEHMRPTTVPQN